MAWGWTEIIDTAIKLLAPAASAAASTAVQGAMAPSMPGPAPVAGPMSPSAAQGAGASAAGAGQAGNAPTSMNFQGGFTGQAPSDPAQGPKPISSGFTSIDPKKKDPMQQALGGGGFTGV